MLQISIFQNWKNHLILCSRSPPQNITRVQLVKDFHRDIPSSPLCRLPLFFNPLNSQDLIFNSPL